MTKIYWVIDGDDHLTSYNGDADKAEWFATHQEAEDRAAELADNEPGKTFYVCVSIAAVACAVSDATVTPIRD
jgi:hypothetical protein